MQINIQTILTLLVLAVFADGQIASKHKHNGKSTTSDQSTDIATTSGSSNLGTSTIDASADMASTWPASTPDTSSIPTAPDVVNDGSTSMSGSMAVTMADVSTSSWSPTSTWSTWSSSLSSMAPTMAMPSNSNMPSATPFRTAAASDASLQLPTLAVMGTLMASLAFCMR